MEAMHCLRSRECFFENNAKMMILCVCNGWTVFFRGGLEWPICPLYRPPCLIHTTHPPPLLKTLKTPFHQPREGKYHSYLQFAKIICNHIPNFLGFYPPGGITCIASLPSIHIALLDPSVGIFIIQSHISYKTYNGWISRPIDRTWVL